MKFIQIKSAALGESQSFLNLTTLFSNCFVYLLFHEGKVVYVGQSKSVGGRIPQHKADKQFDEVHAIPVPESSLTPVESALIRLLKPKYNRTSIGPATSEDNLLAAQFGVVVTENMLYKTKPFVTHHYGPVFCVEGLNEGRVGYYDDDDGESNHTCSDLIEELKLDPETLSDDQFKAICEKCECQDMAIVYFGSWEEGPDYESYEDLLLLEPSLPLEEAMLERLFPGFTEDAKKFKKEALRL